MRHSLSGLVRRVLLAEMEETSHPPAALRPYAHGVVQYSAARAARESGKYLDSEAALRAIGRDVWTHVEDLAPEIMRSPVSPITREEIAHLQNTDADAVLKGDWSHVSEELSEERDVEAIERDIRAGRPILPPIVVSYPGGMWLLGGNTRLCVGVSMGYLLPVVRLHVPEEVQETQPQEDRPLLWDRYVYHISPSSRIREFKPREFWISDDGSKSSGRSMGGETGGFRERRVYAVPHEMTPFYSLPRDKWRAVISGDQRQETIFLAKRGVKLLTDRESLLVEKDDIAALRAHQFTVYAFDKKDFTQLDSMEWVSKKSVTPVWKKTFTDSVRYIVENKGWSLVPVDGIRSIVNDMIGLGLNVRSEGFVSPDEAGSYEVLSGQDGTSQVGVGSDQGTVEFGSLGHFGSRGAGALLTTGDRVLLLLRSAHVTEPGTWGIPGGAMDEDERPVDTAVRETREEIGIDLTKIEHRVMGEYTWKSTDSNFTYTSIVLRVPENLMTSYLELNWESDAGRWVNEDWVRRNKGLLHPGLKKYIDHLLPKAFD